MVGLCLYRGNNPNRKGSVACTIPFNNAAERALGGVALGRRNWTFAGSDEGGRRAAALYSLIRTCMCGWPPRCKGFVGAFDAGSAACMCPAYLWRPWPLALMRSADRALIKLTRLKRLHVCWMPRSRRSTVASSPPSAPMHHNRPPHCCSGRLFFIPFDKLRRASTTPRRCAPSCLPARPLRASTACER